MIKAIREFIREEQGQDLIEYSLLLTFVLFAVAGIFYGYTDSVKGITTTTNSNLAAANSFIR
jgi:Flp pilus assembly pilin Flp